MVALVISLVMIVTSLIATPVNTLAVESAESTYNRISGLIIDNIEGIIDQDATTITFNVPAHRVDNGRFVGIINDFIADDETLSTNELIRLMARVMNKPARIWSLSPKLILWLAKIGTFIHFPLNTERIHKLTENYVVSNEKIKKALGIKKMPIPAENGFEITIKSFENNQK